MNMVQSRCLSWCFAILVFVHTLPLQVANAQTPSTLKPTPKTVAWGYYDAKAAPVLRVKSGDTVEIQTLITSSPKRLEDACLPADQVEQSLRDITDQVKDKGPGAHIQAVRSGQGTVKPAGEGKAMHSFGGFDFLLAAPKKEKN